MESAGQGIVGNVEAAMSGPAPADIPLALEKSDAALLVAEFEVVSRSKVGR